MVKGIFLAVFLFSYLAVGGGVLWAVNYCYQPRNPPFGLVTDIVYVAAWPMLIGARLVMPPVACTR